MPEIPAATGHRVPLRLAAGKFSVTEDFDEIRSESIHLATPGNIERMIKDSNTGAVVFSPGWRWNFAWSVPSYHFVSKEKTDSIFKEVVEDFELGFENQNYVIFIRKGIPKAE
jgi:hypothetical protein